MKYISQYSDRLGQAFKRIEELEKENTQLRRELDRLLAGKQRQQQGTPYSTKSSDPKEQPHYARSTTASCSKEKSATQQPMQSKCATERRVLIDGKLYAYEAGVPRHISSPGYQLFSPGSPGYMGLTKAYSVRQLQIFLGNFERERKQEEIKKRRISQPLPKPPPEWDSWGTDNPHPAPPKDESDWTYEAKPAENETPADESLEIPSSMTDDYKKYDPSWELVIRSRLNDGLSVTDVSPPIESKKGFDFLRRAVEIVQQTIFDIVKSGAPGWDGDNFEDGPHAVRLGRDELLSWIGSRSQNKLIYNGHQPKRIHDELLSIVPLRNSLCHPSGWLFRDAHWLDEKISRAHRLVVTLGDENAAMEIRGIRDAVRNETYQSLQEIKGIYFLSIQPHPENMDFHFRLVPFFKGVLSSDKRGAWKNTKDEREVLAVAQAWALQNNYEV
ncbi:hypothetical protein F5Y14DRAFT_452194 [Nemania sp. NC0429]|nr:hypothetical protein F5Y14DRAFT_452194 [Nemania sp. NC0429]